MLIATFEKMSAALIATKSTKRSLNTILGCLYVVESKGFADL